MLQMRILTEGALLLLLLLLSAQDLRTGRISGRLVFLSFLPGLLRMSVCLLPGGGNILFQLAGLLPGLFFWLLSRSTGRAMGEGDGLVLMAMGAVLGISGCMLALSMALLPAAFCAGFLIVVKRRKGKARIPFIPFLAAGFLAGICIS